MARFLSCVVAVHAVIGVSSANSPSAPSPKSVTIENDPRLQVGITLNRPRVYLGELLPELQAKTDVELSVSDLTAPLSGIPLTAVVRKVPARDVLTGIRTLLTTRYQPWRWEKSRTGAYKLVPGFTPAQAAGRARAALYEQWAADFRTYHALARLEEPERSQRAKAFPHLVHPAGHDWQSAEPLARMSAQEIEAFLRSPSPKGPGLAVEAGAPGAGLTFTWDGLSLCPLVSGPGGMGLFGGINWNHNWIAMTEPGWRDVWHPEIKEWRKTRLPDPAAGRYGPPMTLPQWIEQAGRVQGLNVLSEAVVDPLGKMRSWLGTRPEDTVCAMTDSRHSSRMWKSLFLVRNNSTLIEPREGLVAWKVISRFREDARAHGGILSLNSLVEAGPLSPPQLAALEEEFPDLSPDSFQAWQVVLRFREALTANQRRELESEKGLTLTTVPRKALSILTSAEDLLNRIGQYYIRQRGTNVSAHFNPAATVERPGEPPRLLWRLRTQDHAGHRITMRREPRRRLEPVGDSK